MTDIDYYDPGALFGQQLEDLGIDLSEVGIYGKTWEFDFDTGDFVTDVDGHVQTVAGPDALVQALRKRLSTRRYTYLGYRFAYGNDLAAYLAEPPSGATNAWLAEVATRDAIATDPRVLDAVELAVTIDTGTEEGTVEGTILDRYGAIIEVDIPFRFDT